MVGSSSDNSARSRPGPPTTTRSAPCCSTSPAFPLPQASVAAARRAPPALRRYSGRSG
jgi:hypothetical protein